MADASVASDCSDEGYLSEEEVPVSNGGGLSAATAAGPSEKPNMMHRIDQASQASSEGDEDEPRVRAGQRLGGASASFNNKVDESAKPIEYQSCDFWSKGHLHYAEENGLPFPENTVTCFSACTGMWTEGMAWDVYFVENHGMLFYKSSLHSIRI